MCNFTLRLGTALPGLLLAGFAALPNGAQSQVRADAYHDNRTLLTSLPGLAVTELLSAAGTVSPALVGVSLRTFLTIAQNPDNPTQNSFPNNASLMQIKTTKCTRPA